MGCNTSQEQLQTAVSGGGGDGVTAAAGEDNENCLDSHNNDGNINDDMNTIENGTDANEGSALDKTIINLDKMKLCDRLEVDDNYMTKNVQKEESQIILMDSNKQIEEQDLEDAKKAAVKIQATFRGHRVRSSMKQGDKSETMEKKCENKCKNDTSLSSSTAAAAAAGSAADKNKQPEEEEEMTKEQLEAEFDPNDKELCDAAVRIQSAFRGHLNRKLAEADIKDDKDLEEITKKVAEELDIDLTDPELNKAATKIQASFRGYKTRREV